MSINATLNSPRITAAPASFPQNGIKAKGIPEKNFIANLGREIRRFMPYAYANI